MTLMIYEPNTFNYEPIVQVNTETGRYYTVHNHGWRLPSVTTILSSTTDKTFLKEWRDRIGDVEADKIVKQSTDIGTALHENLENYIKYGAEPTGNVLTKLMTKSVIQNGFKKVTSVVGCEVGLYVPELYAGTADVIFLHDGELAIGDFKNSRTMKNKDDIESYYMQTCSYALAHNTLYGTDIKKSVILMASQDGKYSEFLLEGEKFESYMTRWIETLDLFYKNHGHLYRN